MHGQLKNVWVENVSSAIYNWMETCDTYSFSAWYENFEHSDGSTVKEIVVYLMMILKCSKNSLKQHFQWLVSMEVLESF